MAKKRKKRWIAGAVKHPGAMREMAKRMGHLREDGTIDPAWLAQMAKKPGKTGRRARLAMTFRGMHH